MIQISDWLLQYYWALLFIPVFVIAFMKFRNSKWGHIVLDPIVLRLPVFGPLARKVAITRFTRTFGTLTQSGVPILEALEVSKNTASNDVIKRAIIYTRDRIREGESIHGPMKRTKVFPPIVTNLISVGEEAGNLEEILFKLSDYYDDEIDSTIRAMASLIEPMMIVLIGGIVGVIVISLYLPIFNLVNVIK
jgi:type IV pilus assembly protein PilC